jgi:hypothetical protein
MWVNTIFTLDYTPIAGTEHLYLGGILQLAGVSNEYTLVGNTITFATAPWTGAVLQISYQR